MNTNWVSEARKAGEREFWKSLPVFVLVVLTVVVIPLMVEHFFGVGLTTLLVIFLTLIAITWLKPVNWRRR